MTMKYQKGLSLVELMISLTLGIVLMTGVVQMFLTSRITYNTQQAISRVQESGRIAMDILTTDLRMAGYMGCLNDSMDVSYGLEASPDYRYQFDQGVLGLEGDAAALTEVLGVGEASPDSEAIVVRRASSGSAPLVEEHVEATNANLKVAGTPADGCILGGVLCQGSVAIISDCTKGRVFRAVNVSQGGGKTTIAHSVGGGTSPKNSDNVLGNLAFGPGAEVMALTSSTYYVAPSSFPNGDVEVLSLWMKQGEEDPVELVEGVERMAFEYGVDNDVDNGPPIDEYLTLDEMDVADWANLRAVRVSLLLYGLDENVLPEPQSIEFAGEALADEVVADRRMRQVFTTTVGIRGRTN